MHSKSVLKRWIEMGRDISDVDMTEEERQFWIEYDNQGRREATGVEKLPGTEQGRRGNRRGTK